MKPALEKVPWDEISGYDVRFEVNRTLMPSEEPNEYVQPIHGEILWSDRDEGTTPSSECVGYIRAFIIQAGRALNHKESLFEVCDCDSQETLEVFESIYDVEEECLKDSVSDGCSGQDALVIQIVDLLPKHRGHRVGQLAVLRLIEDFGEHVAVAILKPYPIQASSSQKEGRRSAESEQYRERFQLDRFDQDKTQAQDKLRHYWGELGFTQVPGSEWFVLDLQYTHPGFDDFVEMG